MGQHEKQLCWNLANHTQLRPKPLELCINAHLPRPQTEQLVDPGCATDPSTHALQRRPAISITELAGHLGRTALVRVSTPSTNLSTMGRLGVGTSALTSAVGLVE